MARGLLSGVIMGTVVAGLGAGGVSLLVGPPDRTPIAPAPDATVAQAPEGQSAPEEGAAQAALPDAGDAPTASAAGESTQAPTPDDANVDTDAREGAPAPQTGSAEEAAQAPEEGAAPQVDSAESESTAPQTAEGLVAPEGEAEIAVDSEPAQPAETQAEEPAEEATEEVTEDVAEQSPEAEPAPEPLPDNEREEITLEIAPETPNLDTEQTGERTGLGTPAKTLGSGSSSRLPSVQAEAREADNSDSAEAPAPAATGDGRPVTEFAAPFEGDAAKPKMAIVLIDDGTSNIGVEALTTFPYPLSFAVDTSWKGAKDAMATYRAAGFEVLAMVDLPRGARASDVEVNLPILLANVPEAVGVIETPDAGLQESRDVSAQLTEYLAGSGHGLVLFPKGLNTAQKVAAKEGVPSTTVFRDFDAKGQNASAIKRFLNHAALKAGSEGGVVMVGRLRADTISALLLWGLQDRSDRLELAPVTQLMKAQN